MRTSIGAIGATALLLTCTACTAPESPEPEMITSTVTVTADETPEDDAQDITAAEANQDVDLEAIADSSAALYGGTVGIAVASGSTVLSGGDDGAYPAWSTSKVPLAIAAYRTVPDAADTFAPLAIVASDNANADKLWAAVTPEDVDQVFADAGVDVSVNTEKTRPEFSTYGQTLISAGQEATLAAGLPCLQGAQPVLSLMANVSPSQAYGLGELPGARIKGGWGPAPDGSYQVRQMALVSNSRGDDVAIGLTVNTDGGDYTTAQVIASAVAAQLRPLLDDLPTTTC